jgi:uncharacterized protein with FMN-binding domain
MGKRVIYIVSRVLRLAALSCALAVAGSCDGTPPELTRLDASGTKDGEWIGAWSYFPNQAKVKVRTSAGRIESIDLLEHFHGQGAKAEAIVDEVVRRQSLAVDAVAGATHSSQTILKAIETALAEAAKE